MRFGYREACLDHDTGPRHPESPERLRAIRRALSGEHGVAYEDGEVATPETVRAVHDDEYVTDVREFCEAGGGEWDADTVGVEATWEAALASAGLACWAAEEALDGASGRETPFSLGRPPGHHAVTDDAMGFCFFNNAAIAAQHALDSGRAERVAILDWDVHHGNGTQDIFHDRGDVFYASLHEDGLYPRTGTVAETGEGDGEGTTLNLPFPARSANAAYLAAFEEAIRPAIERFDPDLVLVSAGFDAHEHDPISRLRVATECYGVLTARVRAMADEIDAGLGFVLEGGYGLDTLGDSIVVVNQVYNGYEPVESEGTVSEDARAVIEAAKRAHGIETADEEVRS